MNNSEDGHVATLIFEHGWAVISFDALLSSTHLAIDPIEAPVCGIH